MMRTGRLGNVWARAGSLKTVNANISANQLAQQVGKAKAKGEDASALMAEVTAQAETLKSLEQQLQVVQTDLNDFLSGIPNIPQSTVPIGKSADDNIEVRKVGVPRDFDF